jgi:hypothetical protein
VPVTTTTATGRPIPQSLLEAGPNAYERPPVALKAKPHHPPQNEQASS